MKRALIIGGSVGGLFAAHLLRSIGWDVLVFERNTGDLAGRGVGIGTQDVLHDVMQRVGLRDDATMAVDTKSCACIGDDGRVLHEIRLRRVTSAWARFYRPLKDALPDANYRPGWRLERVDQTGDRVTAVFANGEAFTGDLLVGADGIRSTVRAQMLPDVQPVYSGYIGWRSLIPEAEVPAALREAVFDRYTFVLPPNELVVAYPVPALDGGTTPGRRAYNIVWYRPADRDALAELCTDASGQRHESIPPPLIRPEVIASMKADAARRLPSLIADILKLVPRPFFHPISDMLSPKLVFGRVALLGDAAFLPRPHGGSGVTKASLDAAALADALTDAETDSGLARYEERQLQLGEWIVQRGRELGAYVNVRKDRRPDALVREYNATNADLNTFLAAQRSRVRS
jgi:2-polyprenyl-6-methoxyphenol hydroxylase-like FAD-dependent oxidoreductase